jgi:hypothetical protein
MIVQSPDINFKKTYKLNEVYESVEERAKHLLGNYLSDPGLLVFNEADRSITFSSERLIPTGSTNRPRVMLLFSNPHPHSIQEGMFLSPTTKGHENSFWPIMEDAGWLPIPKANRDPKQLAEICLKANYEGPFELIFYCYYAFPTNYPEDIRKIFGSSYFSQCIEPETMEDFKETIQDTSVQAVVTFNKGIFNLVSGKQVERYINDLKEGRLIQGQIKAIDKDIPIFLSFPTGWHYHKDYKQLRKDSLVRIRNAIEGN